jgi:hypothetical protein
MLDVIIVGSRGSEKDYQGLVKALIPPQITGKPMSKDIAKNLQKKFSKKPKG